MKYRHANGAKNILSIIMLVLVFILIVTMVFLVRIKILQNTQEFGTMLAKSYAFEEQTQLDFFKERVYLMSAYIDEMVANKADSRQIQNGLTNYYHHLEDAVGENTFFAYAIINGEAFTSKPWDGKDTYDYSGAKWYSDAIEADGAVVVGDAYFDVITGDPVYTISKELSNKGDVFALDVYIENDNLHNASQSIPENASVFLCDSNGGLLYKNTKLSDTESASYVSYLMQGISNGEYASYDDSITDLQGVKRGVYYDSLDNGWTVVITIPMNDILIGDSNAFIYIIACIGLGSFAAVLIIVIRDILQSREMRKAVNTMYALGNSYFAIFRINFVTGTYELFKLADNVSTPLPKTGKYDLLAAKIKSSIKESSEQEFDYNFSIENIKKRVQDGVRDFGGDYRYTLPDGEKWVNIRTLFDSSFSSDEVIMCFKEIDSEKRINLQNRIALENAIAESQKSIKAKSEFFSNMSHDMRTPLNAIINFSNLAQINGENPEKVKDYLQKINISGKQLLNLINDILEISKIEAGHNFLNCKEFCVTTLIDEVAGIFRDQAEAEGKVFTTAFDIHDSQVVGDSFKIGQILNNLLSNSLKYSNRGDRISLSVKQFAFEKHSKYQFIVSDTGLGMSKEFTQKVFEPFLRETNYTDRQIVGVGLGMTIVKSLVQQMDGEVSVESELGKGSTFTVTIPLEIVQSADAEPHKENPEESSFDLDGKTILLAEDNELNMEIATEILSMCGCEIMQAKNGKEAVALFRDSEPFSIDAILMDMQMPVMDGCTAAREIRATDRADAASVPIIAVTANAFAEDIDKTTKAGMNSHISKPIAIDQLCATLSALIKNDPGESPADADRSMPNNGI